MSTVSTAACIDDIRSWRYNIVVVLLQRFRSGMISTGIVALLVGLLVLPLGTWDGSVDGESSDRQELSAQDVQSTYLFLPEVAASAALVHTLAVRERLRASAEKDQLRSAPRVLDPGLHPICGLMQSPESRRGQAAQVNPLKPDFPTSKAHSQRGPPRLS